MRYHLVPPSAFGMSFQSQVEHPERSLTLCPPSLQPPVPTKVPSAASPPDEHQGFVQTFQQLVWKLYVTLSYMDACNCHPSYVISICRFWKNAKLSFGFITNQRSGQVDFEQSWLSKGNNKYIILVQVHHLHAWVRMKAKKGGHLERSNFSGINIIFHSMSPTVSFIAVGNRTTILSTRKFNVWRTKNGGIKHDSFIIFRH